MRYLSATATAAGRSGFCADVLDEGLTGPRLVVVGDGAHRFAIGKFEVSEARPCAVLRAERPLRERRRTADQPATGVGIELAMAYADWLSQRSGRHYRLPTRDEWEHVARAGKPDPNRNCQVRVSGVSRGRETVPVTSGAQNELGLVNLFGNVREWADGWRQAGGDGWFVCGSDFCVRRARGASVASAGDPATGLRLVREVP